MHFPLGWDSRRAIQWWQKGVLIMLCDVWYSCLQPPEEGEAVPQGSLHVVDVRVDLLQTVLDFLIRMTLAVKGVQFHFGFEIL